MLNEDDETDTYGDYANDCRQLLSSRLRRAARYPRAFDVEHYFFGDSAVSYTALQSAFAVLGEGSVERCIVGAVDSLLEPDCLRWALAMRRLKSESQPCGLVPGEAAVFLELATPAFAQRMGRPIQGLLGRAEVEHESAPGSAAAPPQGEALARALGRVMQGRVDAKVDLMLGNLNGEDVRAHDWGFAQLRLQPTFPTLHNARSWYPATSFGDVGCAAAPLAIGIATQALSRGWAGGDDVLVWCAAEGRARAATLVSRPSSPSVAPTGASGRPPTAAR